MQLKQAQVIEGLAREERAQESHKKHSRSRKASQRECVPYLQVLCLKLVFVKQAQCTGALRKRRGLFG